jgi:ketosteroid isomerase-like protein
MSAPNNRAIAIAWFAAFNAHDLKALLALYHDNAQHFSPKLKVRRPETNGLIHGKEALRMWWRDAFDRLPTLRYEVVKLTADDDQVFMEYIRHVEGEGDLRVGEAPAGHGQPDVRDQQPHVLPAGRTAGEGHHTRQHAGAGGERHDEHAADSYLAIFTFTQLGQSAEEADSHDERLRKSSARVAKSGVKEKDVFTDMLSFVPVYEIETTRKFFSKTYQEVPAGFEIQKNIHIKFTDARMLDKLVTAAAKEEIYDLVKVDFFVRSKAPATTRCACSPPSCCTES